MRTHLFKIIEELVLWENTTNDEVLEKARAEIRQSWREVCQLNKDHPMAKELFSPDKLPALHDPFAGGGTIPLEAQRLGLQSFASDLNPVAVLINKALIEIPPKFANRPPVRPESQSSKSGKLGLEETWTGAAGLAEDVRYYGQWMREEAFKRIGHLYPPIEITKAMVKERPDLKQYEGEKLTVIAWLWARTVKSPNPVFNHVEVPLVSTFILSSKQGKEAYVEPVVGKSGYTFTVKVGNPPAAAKGGTTAGKRKAFRCLMSDAPIDYDYIRDQGKTVGLGQKLMAIVAEGTRGRVYLAPTADQEVFAAKANPDWQPDNKLPDNPRDFKTPNYGMTTFGDLFTRRQLVALATFSDIVSEAREKIYADAISVGMPNDDRSLADDGNEVKAYAEAISVYLGFSLSKQADWCNAFSSYIPAIEGLGHLFSKQAIPMVWDFIETNLFSNSAGNITNHIDWVCKMIEATPSRGQGRANQANASELFDATQQCFVSTDPPYYDNIGYADLSDFFYVWLRRSLRSVFPELLATIAVPKAEELVATPYRHGTKEKAEKFFLNGMTRAMKNLALEAHPAAPITIYYAFKQSELEEEGTNSTGWETFLDAVLKAGLAITGTWPMRTERAARSIGQGTNALASSIVLVCRPRDASSGSISRRQFIRELNASLPLALDAMTREGEGLNSPVAPVDLSQAIIGPGMAIFSRYEAVLEADGTPMSVRTALQLINRFLAEDDFDADTQFCLHWFEQYGWETGKFGEADTLARAKGTSVDGVKNSGVLHSAGGNVRVLKWAEYSSDWDPKSDDRLPIWEVLHQLIRVFNTDGESGAAAVFAAVQSKAEAARQLAYRLYTLCERKNWAEDARAYNEVVTSWSGIESAAAKEPTAIQPMLFDN
jgi:putative DNA methylase